MLMSNRDLTIFPITEVRSGIPSMGLGLSNADQNIAA